MNGRDSERGTTIAEAEHSFEPFARHTFYHKLNEHLMKRASRAGHGRILDMACGTGLLSRLLDKIPQGNTRGGGNGGVGQRLMVGIDLSRQALQSFLREAESIRVNLVQGCAEHVPVKSGSFDTLVLGNAIHLIRDKVSAVAEAARVLRKDGLFAFNTTFFEGAYPEETYSFYRTWVLKALRALRRYPDVKVVKSGKVEAMKWLTAEEYRQLLEGQGFRVVHMELEAAELTLDSLRDISEFRDFAEGALPGVPVDIASKALREAVEDAFREQRREFLPRNWLQVVSLRV